jgi:hypothetical protein
MVSRMDVLKLVEQKIGRDAVIREIDKLCESPLTFSSYPQNTTFFDRLSDFIFANL